MLGNGVNKPRHQPSRRKGLLIPIIHFRSHPRLKRAQLRPSTSPTPRLVAIPVLGVGFFFLLGIELTAEDVESPFGMGADELPLEDYCQTIENFVNAALEQDSPTRRNIDAGSAEPSA